MARTDPDNAINDRAAEWAVEAVYGNLTSRDRAELEAWLLADSRHRGAYVRARALLLATENAVATSCTPGEDARARRCPSDDVSGRRPCDNDNEHDHDVGRPQRNEFVLADAHGLTRSVLRWSARAVAGSGALAASVAILLSLGLPSPLPRLQGGGDAVVQIVRLGDGSVARLSPDARIKVVLAADVRNITLLSGEATFDVASDKARPFVVQAGHVYAQAVGTVYSVRRIGHTGGRVEVTEGAVLVWPRDERDQAVRLLAGGTVTLDPGPLNVPQTSPGVPKAPGPDAAQISLDNVSIASAVLRFNRVNNTKIVIADPEIGDLKIIGHYQANDPEGFAQSVAIVAGAELAHTERKIVIKMKR